MQKLEQKELEKQKQHLRQLEQAHKEALRTLIEDDSVKIILKYARSILSQNVTESLSDYSPTYLSKFIFEEQLQIVKAQFEALPNGDCKIEHFLSIMIKAMDFPFEQWPFYLLGFKDMFNEIKEEKRETITYSMFFKYVIGEVLDFKEEEQNTEFQVRFQQQKKQDNLMHDIGIAQFYYINKMRIFIVLDEGAKLLKIYNKEMKIIARFTPNKEKHNKKFPQILGFDYNELNKRLGIVYSDSTFSIINFQNFINKTQLEFEAINSNEVVINFHQKMTKVVYIQMLNRWALISQENKLYIFDYQKHRQQDPQQLVQVKIEDPDLKITNIIQIVKLSSVSVVAGNEMYFFNESLTERMFPKFVHSNSIKIIRYEEEENRFYLCGQEKVVTSFVINRAGPSLYEYFESQSKANISTFELFPAFSSILVVDQHSEIRLYEHKSKTCYQIQNYNHIVKNEKNTIDLLKVAKNEFALYETYNIMFELEKIAIEKDLQYTYLPDTYYDQNKEELYFSVNQQIISFSLAHGEIRKSYNQSTSNVVKHQSFQKGKNIELHIIDDDKNIYDAYFKDAPGQGENRTYRKKLGISSVVRSFLDEEIWFTFVVGDKAIYSVRNDGSNNFTVNSVLNFEDFSPIASANYNSIKKELHLFTKDYQFLRVNAQNYKLLATYSYVFPQDLYEHEEKVIIDLDYDQVMDMDIFLTNQNEIYIVSREEPNLQVYFKIDDHVEKAFKSFRFINFQYFAKHHDGDKNCIVAWDTNGYLVQFDLTKTLAEVGFKKGDKIGLFKYPVKQIHTHKQENTKFKEILLEGKKTPLEKKKKALVFRAHEKQIKMIRRIYLEGMHLLTFAIDGNIKLWQGSECLFSLKLPDLKKIAWNMSHIEKIKHDRSLTEIMKILENIERLYKENSTPQKLIKKNQEEKRENRAENKEMKKVNLEEPIPLEIQSKDVEDIINKTHNINWYSFSNNKNKEQHQLSKTTRVNPHPWRTKTNFMKIFDKASPVNKYKKKMPRDLLSLRVSLDMKDKRQIKQSQKEEELLILPQLRSYVPEKKSSQKKRETENEEEEEENFESCLYVKKEKFSVHINELDEIDKEFKKKWMAMSERKWVPTRKDRKKKMLEVRKGITEGNNTSTKETKYDPIKEIRSIFENHNRETMATKKGRLISIPEIKLNRQELFS